MISILSAFTANFRTYFIASTKAYTTNPLIYFSNPRQLHTNLFSLFLDLPILIFHIIFVTTFFHLLYFQSSSML